MVVARDGYKRKPTADALKDHLHTFVDEGVITGWSVPDQHAFADELPKTNVGKIEKKVLHSKCRTVRTSPGTPGGPFSERA